MQSDMDWSKKYYSEEAQQKIAKRAAIIPSEVIEQAQRDWATLIKEVETAVAGAKIRRATSHRHWRPVGRNYSKGSRVTILKFRQALTRCMQTGPTGPRRCPSRLAMKRRRLLLRPWGIEKEHK